MSKRRFVGLNEKGLADATTEEKIDLLVKVAALQFGLVHRLATKFATDTEEYAIVTMAATTAAELLSFGEVTSEQLLDELTDGMWSKYDEAREVAKDLSDEERRAYLDAVIKGPGEDSGLN